MAEKKPLVVGVNTDYEQLQSGDSLDGYVPYVNAVYTIDVNSQILTGLPSPVNGTDAVNLDFLTEAIEQVVYPANSVTVNTGDNVTGDVTDTQTLSDGNFLEVGEVGGVPGFDIEFDFINVESFSRIWFHYKYVHTLPAHTVQIRFWNYNTASFDVVTSFANVYDGSYQFLDFVVDDTDYIDGSGNAKVSIYHISSGNDGHEIEIDYIALVKAGSGSSNEHGALLGLADDDHLQYHTDARAETWYETNYYVIPEGTTDPLGATGHWLLAWDDTNAAVVWFWSYELPDFSGANERDVLRITSLNTLEWAPRGIDLTPTYMVFVNADTELAGTSKLTFDGTDFTLAANSALIGTDWTAGSVPYIDANKKIQTTANMSYNATSGRTTLIKPSTLYSIERDACVIFPNAEHNQKFDFYFLPNTGGRFEITLTGYFNNANYAGSIKKVISGLFFGSGVSYGVESEIVSVQGFIGDGLTISDLVWDTTNSRWRIQFVHRTNAGTTAVVNIKFIAAVNTASHVDRIANGVFTDIYTTDTTTFPVPIVTLYGQQSQTEGNFVTLGDARRSSLISRIQTTTSTPSELFLNGSTSRMVIPSATSWFFTIKCIARETNNDYSVNAYDIIGTISRDTGGNATIDWQSTIASNEEDATWDFVVSADISTQALTLTATGANSETINWVASIDLVEVTG